MRKQVAIYVLVLMTVLVACTKSEGPKTPAADCDINSGPCTRQLAEGLTATFEIYPRPARSLENISFGILLERGGVPVDGADVTMDFTMPGMWMGKNLYTLKHIGDGVYRSEGVLPRCPKGGKLWQSEVVILLPNSEPASVSYLFEVEK